MVDELLVHDVDNPTRLTTVRPNGRLRVQHVNLEEERTHQSFKDEVDVNKILKRHRDQRLPLPSTDLTYADVSGLTDYRDALDNVAKVRDLFMTLPATSRAYFMNDPASFLDWSFEHTPEEVDALVHGPPKAAPVVPAVVAVEPVSPAEPEKILAEPASKEPA